MFNSRCISFLFLIINYVCFSQQNITNYSSPDTICINQTFTVQNNSSGTISSTYWSFCSSTLAAAPQFTNLGTLGGTFNNPVYMSLNNDGGNYYMFVTNNSNGAISRLFYGNNLSNTPIALNLGTLGGNVPANAEGIYITKEGANWFGVVVGGPIGTIAKLNFGNSLANIPTCVNMGNIGGLNYPHNMQVFNVGNNIYGFTVNRSGNTITRFSFGNSINNTPTGVNLGNIGSVNLPSQLSLINYSGNWYMFICNDGDNTLTRLDFGNNLLNTPTGTNIGNPGNLLNGPRGISISVECSKIKGLIANRGNNILMNMNFPTGPTGAVVLTSLGNPANLSFPQTIERYTVGDSSTYFIVNVLNNTISRIDYANCTSLPSSTLTNLASVTFTTPGTYTLTLMNNFGLYNQSVYCKSIVVGPSISVIASPSLGICSGASVSLTGVGALSYTWDPGPIVSNSIIVNPISTTVYTVNGLTPQGCVATKTISVPVVPTPTLNCTASNSLICSGKTVSLSASGATTYTWNPGLLVGASVTVAPSVTTIYTLSGANGNCVSTTTIEVDVNPTPTIVITPTFAVICLGNSINLTASGASNYTWAPNVALTTTNAAGTTANPNVTTTYTILGSLGTCSNFAVITVTVVALPNLIISPSSATICNGGSASLTVSGAATYTWNPGPIIGNSIIATPSITTIYTVTGLAGSCFNTTTVQVNVNPNPTITANTSSVLICSGASVNLTSSGALTYTWNPGNIIGASVSATPAITTNYTVTGQNAGGCTSTAVVNVTVVVTPTLVISPSSTTICDGNTVTLSVSGASNYTWNPGPFTTTTIAVSPTATIQYTVLGSTGICSNINKVTVLVVPNPTITASAASSVICFGANTTLTANGANTYTWSSSNFLSSTVGSTVTTTPTASICYTVVGFSAFGCMSNSIAVCINVTNTAQTFTTVSTPSILCSGLSSTISSNGANTYTYYPSFTSTPNIIVSPVVTTIYTVQGQFANGCKTTNTISLNVQQTPTVNIITTPSVICIGNQITLEGSGATTYTWNPGSATNTNIIVTPTVSTTYTLYGQTGACTGSMLTNITVNPIPTVSLSIVTPTICKGSATNMFANGATSYTWLPGNFTNSSVVVSPLSSVIFTVTGESLNCFNSNTVMLTVVNNPTVSFVSSSTVACNQAGDIFTVTASGANFYNWLPGGSNSQSIVVTVSVDAVYLLNGTNSFGCSDLDTLFVNVNPNLNYSISQTTICSGKSITLTASGATGYNWLPDNVNTSNIIITPNETTTYTITGTSGQCSKTNTFSIEVIQNPIVDIPEVLTPNDDGKNDFFKINTQYQTKIKINIFNRWGSLVYENDNYDNSWNGYAAGSFQVGHNKLPQGTYYYIIELDDCDHEVVKGYVVIQY